MELNQLNNNFDVNLQQIHQNLNKPESTENKISETSGVKSNIVSLDQNFNNNSNISIQFRDQMNQLAQIQKLEKTVQAQKETVTKLEFVVNNEIDLNNSQTKVNNLLNEYNDRSNYLYNNLNEMVEEQKTDTSKAYFDGVLGSIPLSNNEIVKAVMEQKQNLEQVNKKLSNEVEKITNKFDKLIIQEKEISIEVTKQIDFGKESKDFSNNNLQGIASSVITTQPNPALQSHSIKLLS